MEVCDYFRRGWRRIGFAVSPDKVSETLSLNQSNNNNKIVKLGMAVSVIPATWETEVGGPARAKYESLHKIKEKTTKQKTGR
jgi:hypothetical protein